MAKYGLTHKNAFMCDEDGGNDQDVDVDDMTFLNYPKQEGTGYMLSEGSSSAYSQSWGGDPDPDQSDQSQTDPQILRRQQLMAEMRRIEERTVLSTERSLGLVDESEKMGIQTAEELLHQREQLQNTERKVDEINKNLRISQKHITSIKSVFGGIRNYFSKTPDQPVKPGESVSARSAAPSALEDKLEHVRAQQPASRSVHPALRIQGLDPADDDVDDAAFLRSGGRATSSQQQRQPEVQFEFRTQQFQQLESRMDRNLDDISLGVNRLKGLALGLGDEISSQNDILDRVSDKVEKADIGIDRQNKAMRKILGR